MSGGPHPNKRKFKVGDIIVMSYAEPFIFTIVGIHRYGYEIDIEGISSKKGTGTSDFIDKYGRVLTTKDKLELL